MSIAKNSWMRVYTVMVCIWAMLAVSLPVQAKQRPVNPCDGDCNLDYAKHVIAGNELYHNTKPTSTQLKAAATASGNWIGEQSTYTMLKGIDMKIKQYGESYFLQYVNGQNIYNHAAPFGNLLTAADITAQLDTVTQSQKESMYRYISQYGMQYAIEVYDIYLAQAGGMKVKFPEGTHLPDFGNAPNKANLYFDSLIFVGAVLCLIGAIGTGGAGLILVGTIIGLGGTIGSMSQDFEERNNNELASTRMGNSIFGVDYQYNLAN